ncbi:MAG TPA: 50S ribosomal protein L13 [Candidatus Omnitrophica bacterium]|nr:50S ribosomal protein L13 [Candidatus Omnitrophota bacterium]
MKTTFMAKEKDIKRECYIVDAKDKILGRLATKIATILRGKHKPEFTPHVDVGDRVIVINAANIRVTGNKLKDKIYTRYSGYPSGLRKLSLEGMLAKNPTQVIRLAVKRMLPINPLGRRMFKKLKIFKDDKSHHVTKNSIKLEV